MNQIAAYNRSPDDGERLAYDIAGLLSLNFVRQLPDNDPISDVLALAGQLELPESHRDPDATWAALQKLVTLV